MLIVVARLECTAQRSQPPVGVAPPDALTAPIAARLDRIRGRTAACRGSRRFLERVEVQVSHRHRVVAPFEIAISEVESLPALAQASVRAMGLRTFLSVNRPRRAPEFWLKAAIALMRTALAPTLDRHVALDHRDLLEQAAADAAVMRAGHIEAVERLRAAC